MAFENRRSIRQLIIVGSPRIDYYPLIEAARNFIPPLLFDNLHLISLDKTLVNGLIVCKHCHMLFTDARRNRSVFLRHLRTFHDVERKEPKPEPTIPNKPKINPIQYTETPVTINLMESDKNSTNSVNPNMLGAQVEIQPAAQPNTPEVSDAHTQVLACPTTQSVHKSHHKKKIPIKCGPQPLTVPQCVDTISDQKYIPSAPYPSDDWVDNWEAPLDKRPRSQKRKAPAVKVTKDGSAKPMEKKKASKKPKVTGEWKVSTHEQKTSSIALPILHLSKSHAQPPHANTTPKAHPIASNEAESKELVC